MPGGLRGQSITVSPVLNTTYTATAYYGTNCTDADAVVITVFAPIVLGNIETTPDPVDSLCEGAPVRMRMEVLSGDVESIQWFANGAPIAGATKDSIEVIPMGEQATYTVVATDANGCTAVSEQVVYNTKRCFAIPNAFTPNGDGANDSFRPVFLGGAATIKEFVIYNRWGQKVFEATPTIQAWDGRTDDKLAPSDVYVYRLVVLFGNGEVETYSGDVTLLR